MTVSLDMKSLSPNLNKDVSHHASSSQFPPCKLEFSTGDADNESGMCSRFQGSQCAGTKDCATWEESDQKSESPHLLQVVFIYTPYIRSSLVKAFELSKQYCQFSPFCPLKTLKCLREISTSHLEWLKLQHSSATMRAL